MSEQTIITAEMREDVGKGASRRLRREGRVPAVIYGGHREPANLSLGQNELLHLAENESFYASILEIRVGKDKTQQAVVRDMHRHPYKPVIMHIDFLRVSAEELLRISVPIHFIGEDTSPAGKASGVVIQHQVTEIEIVALPKDLPEFLTADLSRLEPGDSVMLSAIQLPEGVELPAMVAEDAHETQIANAVHVKESQGTGAAAAADAEAILAEGDLGALGVAEDEEDGEDGEDGEEPESDKED
jgi:large subunit ribosomal protein L25